MFKRPGYVMLNINGDDLGRLIGRHGQTSMHYSIS